MSQENKAREHDERVESIPGATQGRKQAGVGVGPRLLVAALVALSILWLVMEQSH